MKSFKKILISLILMLVIPSLAESSELSQIVETTLRKPLNLVSGPATQVVDFKMGDKIYIVVIADLSFNKNITPFGKKTNNNRTSEKEVTLAVKTAFNKLQSRKFKKVKEIFIIVFDKKLFGRTNNKTLRKFIYKGEFNKGQLVKVAKLN